MAAVPAFDCLSDLDLEVESAPEPMCHRFLICFVSDRLRPTRSCVCYQVCISCLLSPCVQGSQTLLFEALGTYARQKP